MVLSQRVYVYGVHFDNTEEFLVSELDIRAAREYCNKHARLFKDRFSHYIYGLPSQEKCNWELYKQEV